MCTFMENSIGLKGLKRRTIACDRTGTYSQLNSRAINQSAGTEIRFIVASHYSLSKVPKEVIFHENLNI